MAQKLYPQIQRHLKSDQHCCQSKTSLGVYAIYLLLTISTAASSNSSLPALNPLMVG